MIHAKAKPLSPESLQGYIMFKLYMAGNTGQMKVPKDIVNKIYRITQGNLRQVNNLMERCLQAAFVHNTTHISRRILKEAYRDFTPTGPFWWPSKSFVWGLSAALVLFLAGWTLSPTKWSTLSAYSASKKNESIGLSRPDEVYKVSIAGRDKTGNVEVSSSSGPFEGYSQENDWETHDARAIETFLAAYGLSAFTETFTDALRTGHLEKVVSAIFEATGLEMVELERLPDNIQRHYGVLGLWKASSGTKTYLLFWKPQFRVTEFYPGYSSGEIKRLEERLALRGFYNHDLDSIVGPNLWAAVKSFQEKNQIRVTGFPDKGTVFLICHQDRSEAHER
jgi:hypothetical protein